MGVLYGKSMTTPRQIPGSPSRLRAQHRKLTSMRYYGNVMTKETSSVYECTVAVADVFYIFNSTVVD